MVVKFKNRMLRYGGEIVFTVSGTSLLGGSLQLVSVTGEAFSITVDPGDGTGKLTYQSVGNYIRLYNVGNANINPGMGYYQCPVWTTGNIQHRVVRISCSNWSVISSMSISGVYFSKPQKYNVPFHLMYRLKNIYLSQGTPYAQITEFDTGVLSLPLFTGLSVLGQFFTTDSRFYGNVQPDVLNPKLTALTWSGVATGNSSTGKNKPFDTTHFTDINPSRLPLLQELGIEYSYVSGYDDSEAGEGAYPDVWNTFPDLRRFSLNLALFTKMPEKLNNLPVTLQVLNLVYLRYVKEWTDLSNLVNLTGIVLTGCPVFTSAIPAWMSALTKLKVLSLSSIGTVANTTDNDWQNNFYTSLYNFVVANAPVTGTAASAFRNMTVNTRQADGSVNNMQLVAGVEQAPAGFVLGVSNGVPASAAERIYVLKQQYGHTISYPA